jgi:ketosteroid isomerase-like protein
MLLPHFVRTWRKSSLALSSNATSDSDEGSQEERHVSLLKEAYKKWHETKAGSVEHWLELMTDDIQFHSLGSGAPKMEFTRTSTCKEEVKDYFSQLTSEWEMIHYTIDEYIAQGDRVVALGRCGFRNKRTGKVLETPKSRLSQISQRQDV